VSRRNELGRQGRVVSIAIDPTNSAIVYIVVSVAGGSGVFRTEDSGESWSCLSDSLYRNKLEGGITCVAINPADPTIIYLGSFEGTIYTSLRVRGGEENQDDNWGDKQQLTPASPVSKIIVDPRDAADPDKRVLYAATAMGVFRRVGKANWAITQKGFINSLCAHFAPLGQPGTTHLYAGVDSTGLYVGNLQAGMPGQVEDPKSAVTWTNLTTAPAVTGLPTKQFSVISVDYCPLNPDRLYTAILRIGGSLPVNGNLEVYTNKTTLNDWQQVGGSVDNIPSDTSASPFLRIAPNSPGREDPSRARSDILFIGSVKLYRSINGGAVWEMCHDAVDFHDDKRCITFVPELPDQSRPNAIPLTYLGCDGGLALSTRFADPGYPSISNPPTDDDYGATSDYKADSGLFQNYNHGLQSSAVHRYASDPSVAALGYQGSQDTGCDAATGSLGWRNIHDGDVGDMAASYGTDGLKLWVSLGGVSVWPKNIVRLCTDNGEYLPPWKDVTWTDASDVLLASTTAPAFAARDDNYLCNFITTLNNDCITGGVGGSSSNPHYFVARIDREGNATRISQDFKPFFVTHVSRHPTNADVLFAVTSNNRVWLCKAGRTANSKTIWEEPPGSGRPDLPIDSIAIQNDPNVGTVVYVLPRSPKILGSKGFGAITYYPLYELQPSQWIALNCSNFPESDPTDPFDNCYALRSDPVVLRRLYAIRRGRVYRIAESSGIWDWQDISEGLPNSALPDDLWIGDIGPGTNPKVLLRIPLTVRGVWERDVTQGSEGKRTVLYVRSNILDQRWLDSCPEGVSNPYKPGDPGANIYHYQSPDIKVDSLQNGRGITPGFFQTDPEGHLPLDHVLFEQLKDNSQTLTGRQRALVHVQVHSRASVEAQGVHVWALFCNASAGVPNLGKLEGGGTFDFWSQFDNATGLIQNLLPSRSPWKAIGDPMPLQGIVASRPRVASWEWTVPESILGDPGHYCVVAFVNSATSPINETNMDVDHIASVNKQIGQKNVHIGPPLAPTAGTPSPGLFAAMQEYVEFHNPTSSWREAVLICDMRTLPPELAVEIRFTKLNTIRLMADSLRGIMNTRRTGAMLPFEPFVYEAKRSARVEVHGVRIAPQSFCAACLTIQNLGTLKMGSEYRFQVQQLTQERVVGGSVYVVRIGV
jgi:hypothetical protein